MSKNNIQLINRLYESFNARDINSVLTALTADVAWANGMEGGHVHGHKALQDYWTRQWEIVSPHVEPIEFQQIKDDVIEVKVIQSIFDLNGQPLSGQSHGLKDTTVMHIFTMKNEKVIRFDLRESI
ncbi:MAG: nuclear transport factor 2 family protein [Moraxellaceae bacterium]|nr:MAG: nuclear transport factor 2 family protein [Moraxellaceae bacterium]